MFKIGQKVVVCFPFQSAIIGEIGIVRAIDNGLFSSIGVEWNKFHPEFHTLCGMCKYGHGWWVPEKWIRRHITLRKRQTRAANKRSTARKPRPKLAKRQLRAA